MHVSGGRPACIYIFRCSSQSFFTPSDYDSVFVCLKQTAIGGSQWFRLRH